VEKSTFDYFGDIGLKVRIFLVVFQQLFEKFEPDHEVLLVETLKLRE